MTHQVAMRRFDLDDIGALVSKHHGRDRSCDHRRQIEYPHSLERARHILTPRNQSVSCYPLGGKFLSRAFWYAGRIATRARYSCKVSDSGIRSVTAQSRQVIRRISATLIWSPIRYRPDFAILGAIASAFSMK